MHQCSPVTLPSTEARRTAPKRVPIFLGLSFSERRRLAIIATHTAALYSEITNQRVLANIQIQDSGVTSRLMAFLSMLLSATMQYAVVVLSGLSISHFENGCHHIAHVMYNTLA